MARTSRSRGKSPFSMRSGNRSTFKKMGSSSPYRDESTRIPHGHEHDDQGNEITYGEERLISTKVTESPTDITTRKKYQTEGTSEDPRLTEFKKRCFDKDGNRLVGKKGCVWAEDVKDPEPIEHTKGRETEDVDPKKKEKCKCMAYNAENKEMGYVHYACDWEGLVNGKHPNCFQRPTGSLCICTDPQGKTHSYPCKSKNCNDCPEPKICEGAKLKCDMTSAEMKAARQKCKEMGTGFSKALKERWIWSNKSCDCVKTQSSGRKLLNKCVGGFSWVKKGTDYTKVPCVVEQQ